MADDYVKKEGRRRKSTLSKGVYVGNYEVQQTIGEGAFAKVKLGIHRLTNQKVAIKIIDKAKLPDEYSMKHIHREAQILRILDHPNIIKLFEVMETKKNLFLILEYAAKGELLDHIVSKGRLSEEDAKRYTKQIMSALDHAHSHNIVHRDLKAENLLLDEQMNIKISDFGLSNFFEKSQSLQTCCGSPVYSAPELIEGKKYTGPEVDSWSLGINVYAMVVGDLPFANSNLTALYDAILKGKYNVPDFVSKDCRDFISKLLVVNPKNRILYSNLLDHPWLAEDSTFLEPLGDTDKYVPFRPTKEDEMDEKILEQMENVGIDRKSAIQAVLTGKFNQAAGLYYMYAYQKLNGIKIEEVQHQRVETEESVSQKPGEDISDELAQVLFQFERAREPVKEPKETQPTSNREKLQGKRRDIVNAPDPKLKRMAPGPAKNRMSTIPPLPEIPHTPKAQEKSLGVANITEEQVHDNQVSPSKYGIPRRSTNHPPIPIDATLYTKEEDVVYDSTMPRTIKFAFNCICHTKMSCGMLFERLSNILDKNDVVWHNDSFLCACEWGDIKFEVEICKLPRLQSFGIRLKRNSGDIWEFKKLSTKITQELESIAVE